MAGIAVVLAAIVSSALAIATGHSHRAAVATSDAPLTKMPTTVHEVTTMADTASGIWISSWSTGVLTRISLATGDETSTMIGQPQETVLSLAAAGQRLFDVRTDTGQVEVRDAASGTLLHSVGQTGNGAVTLLGDQLWTAQCCADSATPSQTITERDPSSLLVRRQVVVSQQGEIAQLAAGTAGVWLLSEDGSDLRRVDTVTPIVASMPAGQTAIQLAVGNNIVVLATADGALIAVDPTTGETKWQTAFGVIQSDVRPRAIAVAGDAVYIAIPGHLLQFNITTHAKTSDQTGISVQRFSTGPHGVWAAVDGSIMQVAR